MIAGSRSEKEIKEKLQEIIELIEQKILRQINEIYCCSEFEKIESSWQGLAYITKSVAVYNHVKLLILPISKKEIFLDMIRSSKLESPDCDKTNMFEKIFGERINSLGADPISVVIVDDYFDSTARDVALQSYFTRFGVACGAPFLLGVAPSMMNCDAWEEIGVRRDVGAIFETPPYRRWQDLRTLADARFLFLTFPRFSWRKPYGAGQADDIEIESVIDSLDRTRTCWINSAYGIAAVVARSFEETGWFKEIAGPHAGDIGIAGNQPSGEPSIEFNVGEDEHAISQLGFVPLAISANPKQLCYFAENSIKIAENLNQQILFSLSSILIESFLSKYIYQLVSEKYRDYKNDDLELALNEWLRTLVGGAFRDHKRPLASGYVEIIQEYSDEIRFARLRIVPGYQSAKSSVEIMRTFWVP